MLWSLLSAYGLAYGWGAQTISYSLTALVVFGAVRSLGLDSFAFAFRCGVIWTIMHIVLDAMYVIPAAGPAALLAPFVWIGYAIVFFTPAVVVCYGKIRWG